jgi:hypothetical protein
MKENYKLQNTNYKQITIKKNKSSHGLHKGHIKSQTMTAFNQKLWGVQGGGFLEKSPPGRRRQNG